MFGWAPGTRPGRRLPGGGQVALSGRSHHVRRRVPYSCVVTRLPGAPLSRPPQQLRKELGADLRRWMLCGVSPQAGTTELPLKQMGTIFGTPDGSETPLGCSGAHQPGGGRGLASQGITKTPSPQPRVAVPGAALRHLVAAPGAAPLGRLS